jgi:hypothetical protein
MMLHALFLQTLHAPLLTSRTRTHINKTKSSNESVIPTSAIVPRKTPTVCNALEAGACTPPTVFVTNGELKTTWYTLEKKIFYIKKMHVLHALYCTVLFFELFADLKETLLVAMCGSELDTNGERLFPSRSTVPMGMEIAGLPVRFAVTVKMSSNT